MWNDENNIRKKEHENGVKYLGLKEQPARSTHACPGHVQPHDEGKHSVLCNLVNFLTQVYMHIKGPPESFQQLCGPQEESSFMAMTHSLLVRTVTKFFFSNTFLLNI